MSVALAIEFLPYTPVATLSGARRIQQALSAPIAVVLDAWMFFRSGADWHELGRLDGNQVQLVQLSDAPKSAEHDLKAESRHRRRLPGQGELDLCRFLNTAALRQYDGPISVEVIADHATLMSITSWAGAVWRAGADALDRAHHGERWER